MSKSERSRKNLASAKQDKKKARVKTEEKTEELTPMEELTKAIEDSEAQTAKLRQKLEQMKQAEEEAKKKAEADAEALKAFENGETYKRVYFVHEKGTLNRKAPIYDPAVASSLDPNYVVVAALLKNGKFVRPLTAEEASKHGF